MSQLLETAKADFIKSTPEIKTSGVITNKDLSTIDILGIFLSKYIEIDEQGFQVVSKGSKFIVEIAIDETIFDFITIENKDYAIKDSEFSAIFGNIYYLENY